MSEPFLNHCRALVPPLVEGAHKGTCGRIGVVGGSPEFTGAPYFAAMSALRTGADLVYVFTVSSAAPVIKSYSPELMVMPYLDSEDPVSLISPWLQRLHSVLIGPGLGRSEKTFDAVTQILLKLKATPTEHRTYRPLVFDADGLYYLSNNPGILDGYAGDIYITPNLMEFKHLCNVFLPNGPQSSPEECCHLLSRRIHTSLTIVVKGRHDLIYHNGVSRKCTEDGSGRRCGGQGDLLSGILALFAAWSGNRRNKQLPHISNTDSDNILSAFSACLITRTCNSLAFAKKGRSMLASDMILEIPNVFKNTFEF